MGFTLKICPVFGVHFIILYPEPEKVGQKLVKALSKSAKPLGNSKGFRICRDYSHSIVSTVNAPCMWFVKKHYMLLKPKYNI